MLELRSSCENCKKPLPPTSEEAMICTYECTFCTDCVENVLLNVCPNCGGGFEKRPIRPKDGLLKHPPQQDSIYKPIDLKTFSPLRDRNVNISPKDR